MPSAQTVFTQAELAQMFDLSVPTISGRLNGTDCVNPGRKPKRYNLVTAAPAILQVSRETLNASEEIARANRERAIKTALENAKLRGELIPADDIAGVLERVAQEIVATLRALPAEMKRANPALTAKDLELVREATAAVCNRVADLSLG